MNLPLPFESGTLDKLNWSKGLLPAIIQHARDGTVLMLGYMNREALEATLMRGRVTFFSRRRETLWTKGESSGNFLNVKAWDWDCDQDALLFQVDPVGPTCHLLRKSCFPGASSPFLHQLDALIDQRKKDRPKGSYTTELFEAGPKRIAQKVGEEGVELALAALDPNDEAFLGEAADLFYHALVLLRARGFGLADVEELLARRHWSSEVNTAFKSTAPITAGS